MIKPKSNLVLLSVVAVPIVAVIIALVALGAMRQDDSPNLVLADTLPIGSLSEVPEVQPVRLATQETRPDRLFRWGTFVSFRTDHGIQEGWIHRFRFDENYNDWRFDIHTPDGIVFNNVFQTHIFGVAIAPGDDPGFDPDNVSDLLCHPSYQGQCLNVDYDCLGSGEDGPLFTGQVAVVGPDVFKLDPDNDKIGCEGVVRRPSPEPTPQPPAPTATPGPPTPTPTPTPLPEPPPDGPPTAFDTTGTVKVGDQVVITLEGEDAETCELDFILRSGPDSGQLTSRVGQPCTEGNPNFDTAAVTYKHDGGDAATDTFTFRVCDGATPAQCDSATVNITITPEPVPPPNNPPTATNLTSTIDAGGQVAVVLQGGDMETCDLEFTVRIEPTSGTLSEIVQEPCKEGSPNADTAELIYSHDGGDAPTDSFTYRACDDATPKACDTGTVSIAIAPPPENTPPTAADLSATIDAGTQVAFGLQGTDAETCDLEFSIRTGPTYGDVSSPASQPCQEGSPHTDTAELIYTNDGTDFDDSFTYLVCDGATPKACDIGTVSIAVNPVVTPEPPTPTPTPAPPTEEPPTPTPTPEPPTPTPTPEPTEETPEPTEEPTEAPTEEPTVEPTQEP
jgi:hypothetical protein